MFNDYDHVHLRCAHYNEISSVVSVQVELVTGWEPYSWRASLKCLMFVFTVQSFHAQWLLRMFNCSLTGERLQYYAADQELSYNTSARFNFFFSQPLRFSMMFYHHFIRNILNWSRVIHISRILAFHRFNTYPTCLPVKQQWKIVPFHLQQLY